MATFEHPLGADGGWALSTPQQGEVRVITATIDVQTEFAAADVIKMCKLGNGMVPVDCTLSATDLDTGAALVLDVGLLDEVQTPADTTDDVLFIAASTVGQAGGIERMVKADSLTLAPVNYDRYVTLTWNTIAGTFAAGSVTVQLSIRGDQSVHEAAVVASAA